MIFSGSVCGKHWLEKMMKLIIMVQKDTKIKMILLVVCYNIFTVLAEQEADEKERLLTLSLCCGPFLLSVCNLVPTGRLGSRADTRGV
jgi:hypothetical protein